MRKLKLFWTGFEIGSLRWRGAPEFGAWISGRGVLWTWRHRQGWAGL